MNSPTSTKVNTFMVDAIDLDGKFAMMEQIIKALKKPVDEKDYQIARLMSKLDLYNPGESNYNLTPREKIDSESLIKTNDNYYDDRSASVATLTIQRLQDMIANTIEAQYGGPSQNFVGYSKPYSKRTEGLPMLIGYQPQKFQQFDGKKNPRKHIAHFIETCSSAGTHGPSHLEAQTHQVTWHPSQIQDQ
ncbi:uncharacterized protein LOC107878190 [Capsicum annuum]|uniref:uncharacterized protein LOC107878190 n=1 Tax=Capsicum annuum TaxID=4072 RepID=UPI001FB13AA6|nr:uncharacterized protein LOC107878190 [Capsicum annuum]